jgi:hypothetical protein
MNTEEHSTSTPPRKLRLADLQVQSFVTALDEHEASQIAGGYPWPTRCLCVLRGIDPGLLQRQSGHLLLRMLNWGLSCLVVNTPACREGQAGNGVPAALG